MTIDAAFNRDKFLLRQKHLSIAEKYFVWDESGNELMFVERPRHLLRNMLALLAGVIAGIVFVAIGIGLLSALSPKPGSAAVWRALWTLSAVAVGLGCILIALVVGVALSAKRHVTFYRKADKAERLLEMLQDQKWVFLTATYTVREPAGTVLAQLKKNYLFNIFRKRWYVNRPDGTLWVVAKEDSILLSLLRRLFGPLFGLLRTNFIILKTGTDILLGEFNRKFTLLDRYMMDMSADRSRELDRRVAVALGVALDTGEGR